VTTWSQTWFTFQRESDCGGYLSSQIISISLLIVSSDRAAFAYDHATASADHSSELEGPLVSRQQPLPRAFDGQANVNAQGSSFCEPREQHVTPPHGTQSSRLR